MVWKEGINEEAGYFVAFCRHLAEALEQKRAWNLEALKNLLADVLAKKAKPQLVTDMAPQRLDHFLAYLFPVGAKVLQECGSSRSYRKWCHHFDRSLCFEAVPQNSHEIWILAGDNFEQIAMDSKKDVFAA